jgi:membrane-bound serine protease (ClpP class)
MTPGDRLLAAVAHPEIAYLLLMLGGVGLFFEITHPGTLLPGVVGAIAVVLAFFGLSLLAANYGGAALILLGAGLCVAELKAGGHGAFAVARGGACWSGSLLLFSGSRAGAAPVPRNGSAPARCSSLAVVGALTFAVAGRCGAAGRQPGQ